MHIKTTVQTFKHLDKFNFTLISNNNYYLELIYKIILIDVKVQIIIHDQ